MDANEQFFLCDQEPEKIDHIIVSCSFAKQLWWSISTVHKRPTMINSATILDHWSQWRQRWTGAERLGVDSIFALVAWEL
jgi:hypothetical protein